MDWSRYRRVIEGPDVFVLVYGKDLVHFIPIEAFATPAETEGFRQLALRAIPQS